MFLIRCQQWIRKQWMWRLFKISSTLILDVGRQKMGYLNRLLFAIDSWDMKKSYQRFCLVSFNLGVFFKPTPTLLNILPIFIFWSPANKLKQTCKVCVDKQQTLLDGHLRILLYKCEVTELTLLKIYSFKKSLCEGMQFSSDLVQTFHFKRAGGEKHRTTLWAFTRTIFRFHNNS